MSEERATLEIIAPTVEEAVEKGISELGLSRNEIEYEVLDEGSKGLLGFGNRQARVRLTLKGAAGAQAERPTPADSQTEVEEKRTIPLADLTPEIENVRSIAQATVTELLDKMQLHHTAVETQVFESDTPDGVPTVVVNVRGDDLSILIGRRAETLNALQYITRLIVGKEIGHGVNLTVDVEGYRTRRERSLRQLARKMASQAIKSGRPLVLEPMPASERRIIHIELRDNPEVRTESLGEDPRRKVNIIPK